MHALIKSEAYYLMTDPVIRKWENGVTLRRREESLRMRLQCTGKAYTNLFMVTVRENSAIVQTGGRSYRMSAAFVLANIGEFLSRQHAHAGFQKWLASRSEI